VLFGLYDGINFFLFFENIFTNPVLFLGSEPNLISLKSTYFWRPEKYCINPSIAYITLAAVFFI